MRSATLDVAAAILETRRLLPTRWWTADGGAEDHASAAAATATLARDAARTENGVPKVSTNTDPEIRLTLAALSNAPRQIARIARGRDEQRLQRQPAADAWSARDIVAHLRACATVWGRSIQRMLTEDHPTVRYVSPRGWIKTTDFLEQDFHDLLRAFSRERRDLLATLRSLDAADWARRATFTGTTSGRAGTVLSYARRIADHEEQHLAQLRRTVGS